MTQPLSYRISQTPYGKALLVSSDYAIRQLHWLDPQSDTGLRHLLRENPDWVENPSLPENISGRPDGYSLQPLGTDFQQRVWQALQSIPLGETRSYSDIAVEIGHPKAVRAVGTAVGQNPIFWLIPCHRVVPKSGGVGNYAYGSELKTRMLLSEGVPL